MNWEKELIRKTKESRHQDVVIDSFTTELKDVIKALTGLDEMYGDSYDESDAKNFIDEFNEARVISIMFFSIKEVKK